MGLREKPAACLFWLVPTLCLLILPLSPLNAAQFYNDWAASNLTAVGAASGPTDDPDNDGLANLGEFAFGTNPLDGRGIGGGVVPLLCPTAGVFQVVIFEQAGHMPGVQIDLDATVDMVNWIQPWWLRTTTNSLPGDPANSVRELFTTWLPATNVFMVRGDVQLVSAGPETANWYVATNGNDSTGNGSIANPYATLAQAVSVASAGNLIYVRGGTYNLTAKLSLSNIGTAANPYRIRAYPGEHPILNCGGVGSGTDGIGLTGAYWQLYGLEISGAPHNAIRIQGGSTAGAGSHNTIEFCSFHDCGNTGFSIGASQTPTTYLASSNLVLNCDAYRNFDPPAGGNADGFSAKWNIGTGNVFRGCRSWENSDDGWDLWMAINPVLIDTCWTWRNGSNFWNDAAFAGNGNGFKLGGSYVATAHRLVHSVAYQNVGNGGKGIDQNNNTGSLTIDNNTSWGNRAADINMNTTPTTSGVITVRNNLVISGTVDIQSSATQISNSWQVISSPAAGTNDVLSLDASFLSAARRDDGSLPETPLVRPVPGGRLVDKGANIGLPFSGSAPDLGAYESPSWP